MQLITSEAVAGIIMLIFLQHPLFIAVQSCIVKQITACHDDLPTVQSQSGLLTSIKDVCYSNIGPQGSHLPAPLQQPYVSVHHAHALRQTVGSDSLHGRHNLSLFIVSTSTCADDRLYCND